MYVREYVEALQEKFQVKIRVAYNTANGISRRYLLTQYNSGPIDYRTVLPNEIVLDLDFDDWRSVYISGTCLTRALGEHGIPFCQVYTGGRGIHIKILFILQPQDAQKLLENHVSMRNVRVLLHRSICRAAKIPLALVGAGKQIDTLVVSWGDDTQGFLVRTIGGVKLDKVTRKKLGIAVLLHEIPAEKPSTSNVENEELEFPDIKAWKVPSSLVTKIIAKTKRFKAIESKDIQQIPLGEHISLPCVKKCLKGLENGKRNSGAQLISIASKCDALSRQKAMEVAEAYFSRIDHDRISMCEIEQWFRWAYGKKDVFWDGRTCGLAMRIGLCDPRCKFRCDSPATAA